MQETSDLYKSLFSQYLNGQIGVRFQTQLLIGSTGEIVIDESRLLNLKTVHKVFSEDTPSVGGCLSGEIHVEFIPTAADIPRQAQLVPMVRLTDGSQFSEWIQKGVFFIDTRRSNPGPSFTSLKIHGYDAMMRAEQDYDESTLAWPAKIRDVVEEIAAAIGVTVDARTKALLNEAYNLHDVQYPSGYSYRETLGYIAAMFAGCFVISDLGELRLVTLDSVPAETRYLVTEGGDAITVGGVRILV